MRITANVRMCFNPRPREGGDRHRGAMRIAVVSIHAPARGATSSASDNTRRAGCNVSIHAPAKGATAITGVMPAWLR